jgi:hypothetical protein
VSLIRNVHNGFHGWQAVADRVGHDELEARDEILNRLAELAQYELPRHGHPQAGLARPGDRREDACPHGSGHNYWKTSPVAVGLRRSSEIAEWIDDGQTALCPRCGIDSVLPVIDGKPDVVLLWAMHRYWFYIPRQL